MECCARWSSKAWLCSGRTPVFSGLWTCPVLLLMGRPQAFPSTLRVPLNARATAVLSSLDAVPKPPLPEPAAGTLDYVPHCGTSQLGLASDSATAAPAGLCLAAPPVLDLADWGQQLKEAAAARLAPPFVRLLFAFGGPNAARLRLAHTGTAGCCQRVPRPRRIGRGSPHAF